MNSGWNAIGNDEYNTETEYILEGDGLSNIVESNTSKLDKKESFESNRIYRVSFGIPEFLLDYPFYSNNNGFSKASYQLIFGNLDLAEGIRKQWLKNEEEAPLNLDTLGGYGNIEEDLFDFRPTQRMEEILMVYSPSNLHSKHIHKNLGIYIERQHEEALAHKISVALMQSKRFGFLKEDIDLESEEGKNEVIYQMGRHIQPHIFVVCSDPEQMKKYERLKTKLKKEFEKLSDVEDLSYEKIKFKFIANSEFPDYIDDYEVIDWTDRLERSEALNKQNDPLVNAINSLTREVKNQTSEIRNQRAGIRIRPPLSSTSKPDTSTAKSPVSRKKRGTEIKEKSKGTGKKKNTQSK